MIFDLFGQLLIRFLPTRRSLSRWFQAEDLISESIAQPAVSCQTQMEERPHAFLNHGFDRGKITLHGVAEYCQRISLGLGTRGNGFQTSLPAVAMQHLPQGHDQL